MSTRTSVVIQVLKQDIGTPNNFSYNLQDLGRLRRVFCHTNHEFLPSKIMSSDVFQWLEV